MKILRRKFIKYVGAGILSVPFFRGLRADYRPRIVVIGGGFGGGSFVRHLNSLNSNLNITLIEKKNKYTTCPFANYVLGGFRSLSSNIFSYKKMGEKINVLHKNVNFIDSERKIIFCEGKDKIFYDWLVLAPGIGFKWDSIEGYTEKSNVNYPHAWSGGNDINRLYNEVKSLEKNCLICISVPEYPYRCPPAPYERASMIAYYLKKKGIKFKILILDNKNNFTKSENFFKAWKDFYGDSIEWISKDKGGKVIKFLPSEKTLFLESGEIIKSDFINIIPDQKASDLLFKSKLISSDWCKINPTTFSLNNHNSIHVIGDSIDAGDMPKSAFSANSQAKVCAENLNNVILDREIQDPVFLNTCYSLAAKYYSFSISSWYRVNFDNTRITSLGSKESSVDLSQFKRRREVDQSYGWYLNITKEIFG